MFAELMWALRVAALHLAVPQRTTRLVGKGPAVGKAAFCGMLFLVWGELRGRPLMGFFLCMILSRNVIFDLCFDFVPHNGKGRCCAKFVCLYLLLITNLHSRLHILKWNQHCRFVSTFKIHTKNVILSTGMWSSSTCLEQSQKYSNFCAFISAHFLGNWIQLLASRY